MPVERYAGKVPAIDPKHLPILLEHIKAGQSTCVSTVMIDDVTALKLANDADMSCMLDYELGCYYFFKRERYKLIRA